MDVKVTSGGGSLDNELNLTVILKASPWVDISATTSDTPTNPI